MYFKDLKPGDVFVFEEYYYIKADPWGYLEDGNLINAFGFSEGDQYGLCEFDDYDEVTLLNAKLQLVVTHLTEVINL